MEEYKLSKDGISTEFQVKKEWSDWRYEEFKQLVGLLEQLNENQLNWLKEATIEDKTVKISNTEAIEINFAIKNILFQFSTLTEPQVVGISIADCLNIVFSCIGNQMNAILFKDLFALKVSEKKFFGFETSIDFDKEHFKTVMRDRIPAPEAQILTLAQAMDYEISIQNSFSKEREATLNLLSGTFESLPIIAALYDTQPFNEDKFNENVSKHYQSDMQELISFFLCTKDVLTSLNLDVQQFSVELKNKPEAIQETASPDTSVTTT